MSDFTPNGFPVLNSDSRNLTTIHIAGRAFTVCREAVDAHTRFLQFLNAVTPFDKDVKSYCGAYDKRVNTNNHSVWSEHSGGGAFDIKASLHPNGVKLPAGWNSTQIDMIHWYLGSTVTGRLYNWGGDFKHTVDSMHFEIKSYSALLEFNKKH